MNLMQAFLEKYGRPPQTGEIADPYRLAELRRAFPQVYVNRRQREKSNVLLFFPQVKKEEGVYFGGSQSWYPRKTQRAAGCGPVACANVIAGYAGMNPEDALKLGLRFGKDGTVAYTDFLDLMQRVYKRMGTLEVPVIRTLADKGALGKVPLKPSLGQQAAGFLQGTLRFAKENGVLLAADVLSCAYCGYEEGLSFIRRGLHSGSAVTLLTVLNRHPLKVYWNGYDAPPKEQKKGMCSHFVTVAGVRSNLQTKRAELLVSSWGKVGVIDYGALHKSWQSPKAAGAGLFYFYKTTSKQQVERQIVTAYGLLPQMAGQTVLKGVQRFVFGNKREK